MIHDLHHYDQKFKIFNKNLYRNFSTFNLPCLLIFYIRFLNLMHKILDLCSVR